MKSPSSWYTKLNTAFLALRYFVIPVGFAIFIGIAHHWPESAAGHLNQQWQSSPRWAPYYHQTETFWNIIFLMFLGILQLAVVWSILEKPGHAILVHWRKRGKPKLAYRKAISLLAVGILLESVLLFFVIYNLTFGDDKTTALISVSSKGYLFLAHMVAAIGMLELLKFNDALPDDYPQITPSK